MQDYDIIVIGAGHAGIEAASLAARCGCSTLVFCTNLETVGLMSCNPAIGGVAKGHVVREIDALGGVMGKAIDATGIHFKMLNDSKGPAVRSPRAQADRNRYKEWMKGHLESLPGCHLMQGLVEAILVDNGRVAGIGIRTGQLFKAKAVILTAGTFMGGVLHIGQAVFPGGRYGELPADAISGSLKNLGFELGRLKTGTPPRVNGRTVDKASMEHHEPDDPPLPFSFCGQTHPENHIVCYMTRTTPETHEILRRNKHRSPLFSGQIQGTGARYCPSVEDKVDKFPERKRHQVVIEPEGLTTEECYVNGLSTSTPPDVQEEMLHSVPGLEKAQIIRYGYAIEYDFCLPTQLKPSLETERVAGLFFAGQINGTSGYEEAGAQGLVAGCNAVRSLREEDPLILGRHEAYTAVMIDDLVTKGTDEPYRLFTSLAEHRLLLRHDIADIRLMPYGRAMGLIDDSTWSLFEDKRKILTDQKERCESVKLPVDVCNELLASVGEAGTDEPMSLAQILRRPKVSISLLIARDEELPRIPRNILPTLEANIKYEGYIRTERDRVQQSKRMASLKIPVDFDYSKVIGLRTQAIHKLTDRRPEDIARATRIPGVSPADIWVLLTAMKSRRR